MARRIGLILGCYFLSILLLTAMLSAGPGFSSAASDANGSASLTEWAIPTDSSLSTRMALDPSGNCCWFLETDSNKIAHFVPSSGIFEEWSIPTEDARPTGIAVAKISGELQVFGTEFSANKIFIFSPDSRMFKEYRLPVAESGPRQIAVEATAHEIHVWFSELGTDGTRNVIGHLVYDPENDQADLFEFSLPDQAGGGPSGVVVGAGVAWFATRSAVLKVDRIQQVLSMWPVPSHNASQTGFVTVDSLDQVWYTARSPAATVDNFVGRLSNESRFREWRLPTVATDPRTVVVDPLTQTPWIVETEQTGAQGRATRLEPSAGGTESDTKPIIMPVEITPQQLEASTSTTSRPQITKMSPSARDVSGLTTGPFTEWLMGPGSYPEDIVIDNAGNLWVLESGNNRIAKLATHDLDFAVSTLTSAVTINQGATGGITVFGISIRDFSGPVTLSASGPLPVGVNFTFSPNPIVIPRAMAVSATLTIEASATAETGAARVVILALSEDGRTRPATLLLLVNKAFSDFAISSEPSNLTIAAGAAGLTIVKVSSLGQFNQEVTLSYVAPPGIAVDFSQNPVRPPTSGAAASNMSILVSASANAGTYQVAIVGTSGLLSRSAALNVTVVTGPSCLVATATYGSELSPEVISLRHFRDNQIQKTLVGRSFMAAFNAWYYSFSPSVAGYLYDHYTERNVMKGVLYPLIGILRLSERLFDLFVPYPEFAAVISGVAASAVIGVLYLGIPLALLRRSVRRTVVPRIGQTLQTSFAAGLTLGLIGVVIGEIILSVEILSLSSVIVVTCVLFLAALLTSKCVSRKASRISRQS